MSSSQSIKGLGLSIRQRILAIAAVSVAGVAVVGAIALHGQTTVTASLRDQQSFAALATSARDIRTDVATLRGIAIELASNRTNPLMVAFRDGIGQAFTDLHSLQSNAETAGLAEQTHAVEALLQGARTDFEPLVATYQALGFGPDEGLNHDVRSAAAALEAPIKAQVLNGGGEDAFRLAAALAGLRLVERSYMAEREQQLLGEIEVASGRFQRAVGKVEFEPDEKTAVETAFAAYTKALQAWVDTDKQAVLGYSRLLGSFDKLDPILKDIASRAGTGQGAAEQALAETQAATRMILVSAVALVFLAAIGLSILTGRSITLPIARLRSAMQQLADGHLDTRIPDTDRADELGAMARTVLVFRDAASERQALGLQQVTDAARQAERSRVMDRIVQEFDQAAEAAIAHVLGTASRLGGAAVALDKSASDVSRDATAATGSVRAAADRIAMASEATHSIARSTADVAMRAQKSSEVAQSVVVQSRRTSEAMVEFNQLAGRIGAVVDLIQSIAAQTNLLALNATIEAARAGEAGRGFAIVAQEVKALAGQTANATSEISAQVEALRSTSEAVADSIVGVDRAIGEMAELASSVSSAVEEQNAAIEGISSNIVGATDEASSGERAMSGVQAIAGKTEVTAREVGDLATALGREADNLSQQLHRFIADLRAA